MRIPLLAVIAGHCVAVAAAGPLPAQRVATIEPPGADRNFIGFVTAAAPDGVVAAVWYEYQQGGELDVRVAVSAAGGGAWGRPIRVGSGYEPSLAVGAGGVVDVAWVHMPATPGLDRPLMHRRSTDGGVSFGPEHVVLPQSGASRMAVSSLGNLVLAGETAAGPVATVSYDGGTFWSPPVSLGAIDELHDMTPLWLGATEIVMLSVAGTATDRIVCGRSDDGGISFGPRATVATGRTGGSWGVAPFGAGELLVAFTTAAGVRVTRSGDNGRSWSAAIAIDGNLADTVAVTGEPGGDAWVNLAPSRWSGWEEQYDHRILRSADGVSWTRVAVPDPLRNCAWDPPGLQALGGGDLRAGSRLGWISRDGGATWQGPTAPSTYHLPVRGTRVLRREDGRLAVLWLDGAGATSEVRARISDIDGDSWSPAVRVTDQVEVSELWPGSRGNPDSSQAWAALATRSGEFVVLWLAAGPADCSATIRLSRSPDGISWAPSVVVGTIPLGYWPPSPLLAEVGTGRLVALWYAEGNGLELSRSLDKGKTWSGTELAAISLGGAVLVGWNDLIGTPKGALFFVASSHSILDDQSVVFASIDLGLSWERSLRDPGDLRLVRAGERLVAWSGLDIAFESWNGGLDWSPLAQGFPQDGMLQGGDDGSLYFRVTLPGNNQPSRLVTASPTGTTWELGTLPVAARAAVGGAVISRYEFGLAFADWTTAAPPGVFFLHAAPGRSGGLLRDATVGTLSPRPDFATRFPLAAYATLQVASGMSDPDAAVLRDEVRPLVLYGLGFESGGPLRLGKTADGLLRISW